ncbi:hypothetical protein IWW50_003373, partial [Coemansia erecta]
MSKDLFEVPFETMLKKLGDNWLSAWRNAKTGKGIYAHETVQSIIAACKTELKDNRQRAKPGSEHNYQVTLDILMRRIESALGRSNLGIHWVDTHKSQMPNRRMPDGVLLIADGDIEQNWRWTVATFELKGDKNGPQNDVLRGQLLSCMTDMSKEQPRRHLIGLTVSKNGEMYVYVCLPSAVYYKKVGALFGGKASEVEVISAVRFLIVLYQELPKDFGFITGKPRGVFSSFTKEDLVGVIPDSDGGTHTEVVVYVNKPVGGRHGHLVGTRSWLYTGEDGTIVKFHWCRPENSEIAIHQKVLDMGIPYVPNLSSTATMKHPTDELQGELLVMQFAGNSISSAIGEGNLSSHVIIDAFAAYSHAILAATSGRDGEMVLHRDISTGNLLIHGAEPFIIDWGLGLCDRDENRVVSTFHCIGTAPFMGIRVLKRKEKRSCVDDLESLFLVLSKCVWSKYGVKGNSYKSLWHQDTSVDSLFDSRSGWLASEESYE